jgi:Rps23 Pro-64 3,4-dihydroxylase Tpa1-like proline 4-hydroxylase
MIKNQLLTEGYYIGKVDEIIKDFETFQKMIDKLVELSHDKKSMYRYRHVIRQHPEFGLSCEIDEIDYRRKMVLDNGWTIGQQWYETMENPENKEILQFFRNAVTEFIPTVYSELNKDNIRYNDSFTLYENGDFIEDHHDGDYLQNLGRLCVILIYLTDEKDYNDGDGTFILTEKNQEVIPLKGNYVILDFTKHDLYHQVREVKNNFRRFSYINFVYNKEKEK